VLPLKPSKRAFILSIIEKIYLNYNCSDENGSDFTKAYFKVLLLEIRKLYFEETKAGFLTDNSSNLVARFISLLEKNCTRKMGVESYAEQLNVSPRHLSDLIKKHTGKTALHHIQERLMSEAKSILIQTNWSISEVSYQLSFKDPSHFGKLFKSYHGITPQMYRVSQKLLR
ncbi:MAG: AraC family transcriptional regulator, partial [Bacteroidota bacterium]